MMRANYYADTDSLYVELRAAEAATTREIAPGVVVDIGADGEVVGIDVDWSLLRAQSRQLEGDRVVRV
jgi:uncharacterized protein YuzE